MEQALASAEVLDLVRRSLDDDKAIDIAVIDLDGKTSIGDYMVLASGGSQRQIGAMTEHLQSKLKSAGIGRVAVEGAAQCDWVLIDVGDVIVHLFRPEVREFYNLEKIWSVPAADGSVAVGTH
jgi:ribosome-associated protein